MAPASLVIRTNDALDVNDFVFEYPHSVDIHLTTHGSDWEWAITSVMAVAFLLIVAWSVVVPTRARVFHYIMALITLVSTISAFCVASNLGFTAIDVEFQRSRDTVQGTNRQIFYVRYIDWFITCPLLLLSLFLSAAAPSATILYTLFLSWVMVVSGLVGALVSSSYKWGFYVFALCSLFGIIFTLFTTGFKFAKAISSEVSKAFVMPAAYLMFIWLLYPISWGLSEGGNVIAPDSEAIFYGVLDVLAKPVFAFFVLFLQRNIDPAALGINMREPTDAVSKPSASGAAAPPVVKEEATA